LPEDEVKEIQKQLKILGEEENFEILNPYTSYEEFLIENWQKNEICSHLESETEFLLKKNEDEFKNSASDFTNKMNFEVNNSYERYIISSKNNYGEK
jgi:hypothetical protein